MNIVGKLTLTGSAVLALSFPALAGVTVNSPANNTTVTSPFELTASASTCSSKGVVSMGYSFDSSPNAAVVNNQSIDTSVAVSAGTHTLHVKAWAPGGYSCVKDVTISVTGGGNSSGSNPPSDADTVSNIQALSGWQTTHDTGGPGSSTGYTDVVSSPSLYGSARRFVTSFQNAGDQRYSVVFSDNTSAKNFFYDGWVYLTSSSKYLANVELDLNQVMPNGETALMGIQCDGYSGNWAYNENLGTDYSVQPHWHSVSGTTCNPRNWSQYTWHHIQVSLSRTDSGAVTYHSVWLDGVETQLNVQAYCAAALHWDPVIMTQFQVDGLGSSGTVTAYLDDLTLSMW